MVEFRTSVKTLKDVAGQEGGVFVSPGEKLSVIEEFIPGKGTFVEDGNIYSSIAGQLSLDMDKRELRITPRTHQPIIPQEDDIVLGKVTNIQEKTLTVRIFQLGDLRLSSSFTGIMHISDVTNGYVKTMNDAFKIGDVIRAKVISTKNRENHLTTRSDNLGVIQAFCIYCGGSLIYERNRLKCSSCGKVDRRKITTDYGKENLLPMKTTISEEA